MARKFVSVVTEGDGQVGFIFGTPDSSDLDRLLGAEIKAENSAVFLEGAFRPGTIYDHAHLSFIDWDIV